MTVFFFWERAWYEHPDLLAILFLCVPLGPRALQPNPNLLSPQNNLFFPGQMLPLSNRNIASTRCFSLSPQPPSDTKHLIRDWGYESLMNTRIIRTLWHVLLAVSALTGFHCPILDQWPKWRLPAFIIFPDILYDFACKLCKPMTIMFDEALKTSTKKRRQDIKIIDVNAGTDL